MSDLRVIALQDNPCSDMEAVAGGAEMAAWLEKHVLQVKFQKKVAMQLNAERGGKEKQQQQQLHKQATALLGEGGGS